MELNERPAEAPAPDLKERIELVMGRLALLSTRLAPVDETTCVEAQHVLSLVTGMVTWESDLPSRRVGYPSCTDLANEVDALLQACSNCASPSAVALLILVRDRLRTGDAIEASHRDLMEQRQSVENRGHRFGRLMTAQDAEKLADMDVERASARRDLAKVNRRGAEVISQHEPLASFGITQRERDIAELAVTFALYGKDSGRWRSLDEAFRSAHAVSMAEAD